MPYPAPKSEPNRYVFIDTAEAYRDTVLALEHREKMCEQIHKHAEQQGLNTTVGFINRHYEWFMRWYTGVIATGYLMNRTGVKLKPGTYKYGRE